MNISKYLIIIGLGIMLVIAGGCHPEAGGEASYFRVVLHNLSDPPSLNPVNANDGASTVMYQAVTQPLLGMNADTYKMVPILAKAMPDVRPLNDSVSALAFEIRPDAVWDNGTPITGHDVAFSVKLMKVPTLNNAAKRVYFEYIRDVEVDATNPKRFRLVCGEYFGMLESVADLHIVPAHIYDPKGVMNGYTVKGLTEKPDSLHQRDTQLVSYGAFFNGTMFQKEVLEGSGAYKFDRWEANQRVVLKKKADWWGKRYENEHHWFEAYPDELVYETIQDMTTALAALRSGQLSVLRGIDPKAFAALQEDTAFTNRFQTFTPPSFSYDYIGINLRDVRLQDVRVRKALAYAMDVDKLLQVAAHSFGERMTCFSHPLARDRVHPTLQPVPFDLQQAAALLRAAGWADTDGDAVLDKTINGKKESLRLTIKTNANNTRRETACLIFQENARKIGIELTIDTKEWTVFATELRAADFDLYVSGWMSGVNESDPKQLWHSTSVGKSNYVGYVSAKADAIVEQIRQETDRKQRALLYHALHSEIYNDVPYIFLLTIHERIAAAKTLDNLHISGITPGYWAAGFKPAAQ